MSKKEHGQSRLRHECNCGKKFEGYWEFISHYNKCDKKESEQ